MKKTKNSTSTTTGGGAAGMRVIVPLQGVVQGRYGLFLGTFIPCALFYFLQLYIKNRGGGGGGDGGRRPTPSPPPEDEDSSSSSSSALQRVHSRLLLLSPRSSGGPAHVSSRAYAVIRQSDGPYYSGLKRVEDDPFDEVDNPNGVIQLALGENRSLLNLVQEWLADHTRETLIGKGLNISGITMYQPFDGLMELKAAAAGFILQVMDRSLRIDPTQIVLTAGVTSGIEVLVFSLADPGNAFLVPSPYSPELDDAVKWRTGVEIIQVPCRSADGFSLSIAAFDRAYNQAKKRGVKVCGIILSNPSNPVGILYNRETLYNLLDFATEKNIHIISNEILVGSTHGNEEFVSMAEVAETEAFDNNRVHIVYDLSRDFSLAGLDIRIIYTMNDIVLSAAKKLSRFSSVSVPTQQLLIYMLSDTKFIQKSISFSREKLSRMYSDFVNSLENLGIRCMKSSGGFYCWVDMSLLIRPYNEEGEMDLWHKLVNIAKINALPGSACHSVEPGWFGLCFAAVSEEHIPLIIQRIGVVLETCKSS